MVSGVSEEPASDGSAGSQNQQESQYHLAEIVDFTELTKNNYF